ncbi:hypothetical protein [Mesobacillus zeae]|uniref:DUF342 domain-containing protein n=1 Tax=Mesobacillus zeae TaxID=1917180 RepID=A0A398BD27_9BACI|nr:hypothetical protein [Mesobacillus zeae]RID87514.1 hypothetical protein D1970_04915 [Mesobacillus zeae]
MTSKKSQKLNSITFTYGNIKDLAAEYEIINIRGSVILHQDIHVKKISSHGHSTFQSNVTAEVLKNAGSCVIKKNCNAKEIVNSGNLKMKNGEATSITGSGKLTVNQSLHTEKLDCLGIIHATEIHARHFQLQLSGESRIERLITDEATIEREKKTLSLWKKKLLCKYILGRNLHLSCTNAETVEGNIVEIGKNCNIKTLYYKEKYTISRDAKVQQIIRSEQ